MWIRKFSNVRFLEGDCDMHCKYMNLKVYSLDWAKNEKNSSINIKKDAFAKLRVSCMIT